MDVRNGTAIQRTLRKRLDWDSAGARPCLTARPRSIHFALPQPPERDRLEVSNRVAARTLPFVATYTVVIETLGTWDQVMVPAWTGASSRETDRIVSDHQAIIKTGGKQYRVQPGTVLRIEKLEGEVGSSITFDEVLLLGKGDQVKIGTPLVGGAKVVGELRAHGRGKKLIVYKFRRRKNYRRKAGHRQSYTEVEIKEISG